MIVVFLPQIFNVLFIWKWCSTPREYRQTDRPTDRQKPTIHFAHYGIVEAKREKRQQKKSKAKMSAVTAAKLTMKWQENCSKKTKRDNHSKTRRKKSNVYLTVMESYAVIITSLLSYDWLFVEVAVVLCQLVNVFSHWPIFFCFFGTSGCNMVNNIIENFVRCLCKLIFLTYIFLINIKITNKQVKKL